MYMKSFIQIALIILIIIIGYFFYEKYFSYQPESKKITNIKSKINNNSDQNLESNLKENFNTEDKSNNLIKNLKYEVMLDGSGKYVIEADLSELNYIDSIETVFMSNVTAEIIDTSNNKIIIVSDEAVFNTVTYNTSFKNNISINYLQNIISSEKIDFNFKENIIIISKNIIYRNFNTLIKTDNIKINLITKKIEMYMNDPEDKIELTTQK
jgi:hypothetical protein